MRNTEAKVLFGFAVLSICCSCFIAQELSVDADRDRRSIDVGWLLRNLLLNSATASDLKANVTRNIANAPRQPPPATTRRPRPSRPPTTAASQPPPPVHPLITLFAGSSQWKLPPPPRPTTTTTTTTTEEPVTLPELLPPARRPHPSFNGLNRPIYGDDYDYYYPSGYDSFVGRGGQRVDPSEYDYSDAPARRAQVRPLPPPSPRPAAPRKAIRNRIAQVPSAAPPQQLPIPQTPPARRRLPTTAPAAAPAPAPTPAAAPQPQRARVLYEYLQREDTSSNDNNDDADEQTEPKAEGGTQQQDENNNGRDDEVDDGAASDGGDNQNPNFGNGAPPFNPYSPRAPKFGHQPYAKSSEKSLFGAQSYFNSEPSIPHRFSSYSTGAGTGFGGSSFSVRHASPAKGTYQFRDAFSDFETTYDGGHLPYGGFGSYKYQI
ncbi:WAS/WASL-interacting protein family member 3-like [Eurosta solidaginis]|uniref:WAS/WASL-interacting protein family member 3-like n=1 Tax=Eurosta solidaginis TaxID=178769 RepID=UPI0035316E61